MPLDSFHPVRRLIQIYILILFVGAAFGAMAASEKPHEDYDLLKTSPLLMRLDKEFSGACPDVIHVKFTQSSTSQFHPPTSTIKIDPGSAKENLEVVLAHESSHLCMANLTKDFSNTEPFRFFDEGFASIMGAEAVGQAEVYKKQALATSAQYARHGKVKFEMIQKWKEYFGIPPEADWNAYQVGSSFIFFARDAFGAEKVREFFGAVGQSGDLDKALLSSFKCSKSSFESEWIKYLSNIKIPPSPKIARMIPNDGQIDVPTSLQEIIVEFDQPMAKKISVSTNCNGEICYKNAYWKSEKVLAIKIPISLKNSTVYTLTLGTKRGLLQSTEGAELPLTSWTFSTVKTK